MPILAVVVSVVLFFVIVRCGRSSDRAQTSEAPSSGVKRTSKASVSSDAGDAGSEYYSDGEYYEEGEYYEDQ